MRFNKIFFILFTSALALVGCSPDTGNYTYTELNDIEIAMPARLSAVLHETLDVEPRLSARSLDESDYAFEWKVYPADNSVPTVLATSRDLHVDVTLPTGAYTLVYTITEREGGFFYRATADLQVNTPFSAGWLVLCDDAGRARLDMYSDIKQKLYTDILPPALGSMNGPLSISYVNQYSIQESPFYLVTEDGTTRLSSNDFAWKEEYRISYEMGDEASRNVVPALVAVNGPGKVIVDNAGGVYYCNNIMGDGLYNKKRSNNFAVAPFVGYDLLTPHFIPVFLLYNQNTKNFMVCAEMFSNTDLLGMTTPVDVSLKAMYTVYGFPFGNYSLFSIPDRTYDLRWMENTTYDPMNMGVGTTYAVMSSASKTMVYGLALGDMMGLRDEKYGNTVTLVMQADLTACTDIAKSRGFAFSSLKNMMYYAVDNKVYRVNLSQTNPTAELDIVLPDDEYVSCLKFYHFTQGVNASRSHNLIVGSVNNDDVGILRIYDGWAQEGVFKGQEPMQQLSGFAPIKDVIYREIISEWDI